MHTRHLLKTPEFTFEQHERAVDFADLMPGFSTADRIAIVAFTPGGILDCSPLMLASIGAFYEELLQSGDNFYEYPDLFAIHVGELHGYHGMIDIWPERREVLVAPDPNAIAGLISDLGITRLIVQDAPRSGDAFEKETVTQMARTLRTIVREGGEPAADSWHITASPAAADLIRASADSSVSVIGKDGAENVHAEAERPRIYTPIDLTEALQIFSSVGDTPERFGMSDAYQKAHGVDEVIIDRHTYLLDAPA